MDPIRDTNATLVDLLDRILDKGLVLNADMIIHVAGIPLLGINLKACLAGMETMLEYGIWQDWDEAQRAFASEENRRKKNEVPLEEGEEVLAKMFASQWYNKGIYHNWRPGHLYITDRRLLLFRKEPPEVLFQCYYKEIKQLTIERKHNIVGKETDYLYIILGSGDIAQLHPTEAKLVKNIINDRIKILGLKLDEDALLPILDETAKRFLIGEERVVHCGKVSYLDQRPGSMYGQVWKPGHLYLTTQRLVWWYDFDEKVSLEVPLCKISGVKVKKEDLGGMLKEKPVLDLIYKDGSSSKVASFTDSAEELNRWQKALDEVIMKCHHVNIAN